MTPTVTSENTVGWFDWMKLYDEVALTTPPYTSVVEVGVAFGKSLLYLAQKIQETGKDIRVVAVDTWTPHMEHHFIWNKDTPNMPDSERVAYEYAEIHNGFYNSFLYNVYHSGLSKIIDIVRADSVIASAMFRPDVIKQDFQIQAQYPDRPKHTNRPVHFAFIDAGHDAVEVKRDIDAWWGVGPEWMAGHDYNRGSEQDFPGVWKTVDEKWGQENVEWVGQTCWVVRRSHIERP